MTGAKSAVFIPGAWMATACWDDFRKPFETAGYTTYSYPWPYLDKGTPAELRAHPPKQLGALGVGQIVDHYEALIAKLPGHPLLIGHSFGGLFVQLLLTRGCGVAGVALDPGPIAGVLPGPTSLLAALPPILNGWRPFTISRDRFAKSFANGNAPEVIAAAYDKLVVPTSGRIFYEAASWIGTSADPKRRTQPLLITGAERDRTVDPFTARGIYNHQRSSKARTDFKMFADHSHYLIGEPGWEAVAKYCLDWAEGVAAAPAVAAA
jgi:pimeloyl-ACP methyl ester carboxylesterase